MLLTESLTYRYPKGPELTFPDLSAKSDHPLLILGQSGVGKTTLLHLLAGLIRPVKGSIHIGTTNLTELSIAELDHFRGQNIGLVFQKAHFAQSLTVEQNLLMAQYLAGFTQDKRKIAELAERLGLGNKLKKKTQKLSLGEQQRVSIARALIKKPDIVLLDDCLSAVDTNTEKQILTLNQSQNGTTISNII